MSELKLDRGTKYAVGVAYARRFDPDYLMFFDADDFLHRGLCAHVHTHPDAPGWYAPEGYMLEWRRRRLALVERDFERLNGSTHILRPDDLALPHDIQPHSDQDAIERGIGRDRLLKLWGTHAYTRGILRDQGVELAPLPFPAAVWVVGTRENRSGRRRAKGIPTPNDGSFRELFGVPDRHTLPRVFGPGRRLARRLIPPTQGD